MKSFQDWNTLQLKIKEGIIKKDYIKHIKKPIEGELLELPLKTPYGDETLFCGNREAFITLTVDGVDVDFSFWVDWFDRICS